MGRLTSLREMAGARVVSFVNAASRAVGRGAGTVVGGRAGLVVAPTLLQALSRDRQIVLVSGTNGKTTTTALVARGWGGAVASNTTGANMPEGLVAALVASPSPRAVLEVDEAWLDHVAPAVAPRAIILLNLSRDQLDRATEVRATAARWRSLCAATSAVVVANASDPLVADAAAAARDVRWVDVPTPWTKDAVSCPRCTSRLRFDGGTWWCEGCDLAKPNEVTTRLGEGLVVGGTPVELSLGVPGEFNRANAALALTGLAALGVDPREAAARMAALTSVAGRYTVRRWGPFTVRMLLAKNPSGFDAQLASLEADRALWIAINDRVADGHDPSWLYDVPFERLVGRRVVCWGERRWDLATRLDYAGVEAVVAEGEPPAGSPTDVDLLANYTAFQDWLSRTVPC